MMKLYPLLNEYITGIFSGFESIPVTRIDDLRKLAAFIQFKLKAGELANLNFICTHNSRRSHLCQIWAETAAAYYGLKGVHTYSGGAEVTAFNPRAVAAIKRAGLEVVGPGGENPHYLVSYAEDAPKMECFSKKYDDIFNPQTDFVAIMTCSDADQNCPFIPGAARRSPIRYQDPKEADDTPHETARYDERCCQIATEMFYLMSLVKGLYGK